MSTKTYTLSLHDALPIYLVRAVQEEADAKRLSYEQLLDAALSKAGISITRRQWPQLVLEDVVRLDRKSTRLNSSHVSISYAVFCLKKKIPTHIHAVRQRT